MTFPSDLSVTVIGDSVTTGVAPYVKNTSPKPIDIRPAGSFQRRRASLKGSPGQQAQLHRVIRLEQTAGQGIGCI